MLFLISWRNVWRNKLRSLVLICSIALGIWAGIFILSFSWGMSKRYVDMAIRDQVSHIQVHNPEFKKDRKINFVIPEVNSGVEKIAELPGVKAASSRLIVNGMISSAAAGSGVSITGIDPEKERFVTGISERVIEGGYFTGEKRNQIFLGEKLAGKLKVKLNHKVVLTFQDANANITAGAFRVIGIFKTSNSVFDESSVFVKKQELNAMLGQDPSTAHEIAVLLDDKADIGIARESVSGIYPEMLVEDWKSIAPELSFVIDSFSQTMYLVISIILLALTFGIINTMLMAVLERIRELGILMAVGMSKPRVFFMIMSETIYLVALGGPLGMLLASVTIYITARKGIDLSAFASGLSAYGMEPVIYPALPLENYFDIMVMVVIAAVVAAIYPSLKALRLKPVNAIRKI